MDVRIHRRRPAACVALTLALALSLPAASAVEGPTAPDFALRSVLGANHRLSEHRGEVVAILFWASWCGECRRELERFEQLRKTYARAGFAVLSVALDKDPAQARSVADAAGVGYPVLIDISKDVSKAYRADELPLLVLVDRHGVVRARHDALDEREERGLLVSLRDLIDE